MLYVFFYRKMNEDSESRLGLQLFWLHTVWRLGKIGIKRGRHAVDGLKAQGKRFAWDVSWRPKGSERVFNKSKWVVSSKKIISDRIDGPTMWKTSPHTKKMDKMTPMSCILHLSVTVIFRQRLWPPIVREGHIFPIPCFWVTMLYITVDPASSAWAVTAWVTFSWQWLLILI